MHSKARVFCLLLLAFGIAAPAFAKGIAEADLRAHIAVLASDDFEGREPGTQGEAKTLDYVAKTWAKYRLKPGGRDGSWFDPVQMIQRGPGQATYRLVAKGRDLRIASNDAIFIGREEHYQKKAVPLYFGGYGIKSDGTVIDGVAGKAVVILFDLPEFGPDDMRNIRARRDALVKAGAEAVIIVADSQGNWAAMRRQILSRPIGLETREKRAPLEVAINSDFAVGMVTAAGGDWDKLRHSAKSGSYKGEALGIDADFDVSTDIYRFKSYNVVGKIPGKKADSGAVFFMAHWDHLGICRPADATDRICNGAVDNASGVAVLTEVARALAAQRYDRDIYFIATTGEESGLLGAYTLADNPPVPLDKIVVAFNLDTVAIAPRGAKVSIMARGMHPALDTAIDGLAEKLGRRPQLSTDANIYLQRQDGWALEQQGVPALLVGGAFADLNLMQKFMGSDYHGPDDELTDRTELGGAAEDADLHVALGKYFASTKKYPGTKAGG